ncbi:hypothetical protein LIER_12545 [Lithospermum erythrorhizon]|uniref:Uncharacterized protein n=1 Tax=Lithospermum erythrorhizon TaxID=34254 RepID=A0AAV3PTJ5_LITER
MWKRLSLPVIKKLKRAEEDEARLRQVQTTAEFLAQQRVEEAIQNFEDTPEYKLAARKDVAYCLFEFVKTYKDSTPSLVASCQEFIRPYPSLMKKCYFDASSSLEESERANPTNPAHGPH